MKVRIEAELSAKNERRTVIRALEMPAPPFAGLFIAGEGWQVEVDRVVFQSGSGDFRVHAVASDDTRSMEEFVRLYEMEGWRVAAAR